MIYTKEGSPVRVRAYCGTHAGRYHAKPLKLLLVSAPDGSAERYAFAYTLRADSGPAEIYKAIDRAPEKILPQHMLPEAIRQAE
jgi:hypothetical protein